MTSQKGRALILSIGDGDDFYEIGSARMTALSVNNRLSDATPVGAAAQEVALAGRAVTVRLSGLFKNSAAEEMLRAAAFAAVVTPCLLAFPNGDSYAADFFVQDYARTGPHDGLEGFAVTLQQSGPGDYTAEA